MGNGQSAEAPRRPPNKLSKPRTNSSMSLLNSKSTGPPSRRDSHMTTAANRQGKISLVVVAEEKEQRESKQKKRLSIFRSKSAQPTSQSLQTKPEHSQIDTGVNIEPFERSSVDNWSRRGSIIHESPDQPHLAPPVDR